MSALPARDEAKPRGRVFRSLYFISQAWPAMLFYLGLVAILCDWLLYWLNIEMMGGLSGIGLVLMIIGGLAAACDALSQAQRDKKTIPINRIPGVFFAAIGLWKIGQATLPFFQG